MDTTAIATARERQGEFCRSPATVTMMLLIAVCALLGTAQAQVGSSGIVQADGRNEQFTPEFANDILFAGPAGIITKSGKNRQLTAAEASLSIPIRNNARKKRSPQAAQPLVGPSGILYPDGRFVQFTTEQVANAVAFGPSGIVQSNGVNTQHNLRRKRSVTSDGDVVGPSAVVFSNGQVVQFSKPGVTIASRGPSGAVLSDGTNVQFS